MRAALKAAIPWDTSIRKSFWPWMTKIGVSQLPTNKSGELAKVRWAILLSFSHGRKLDIIRNNSDCCVQIECDVQSFSGKVACQYGCSYYSFDGFGMAKIVETPKEKIRALRALMKTQTGKDFEFNEKLVSIVSVIRIDCDYYTAKHRPLPGAE